MGGTLDRSVEVLDLDGHPLEVPRARLLGNPLPRGHGQLELLRLPLEADLPDGRVAKEDLALSIESLRRAPAETTRIAREPDERARVEQEHAPTDPRARDLPALAAQTRLPQ